MKILWLTWKDLSHPQAGGAERVNEELAKRLAKDGHEVHLLVGGFPGGAPEDTRCGYRITRVGGRFSVYIAAYRYYQKHVCGWPDLVIDEVNTIPFFAKWYVKENNILFVHQLAREIWFYQMFFPLNIIGYLLEPLYLWLLSDRRVITISESSKRDLIKYGFREEHISIISMGIETSPLERLEKTANQKYDDPTILALGAIRAMKRTLHILSAFEITQKSTPRLKLIVAGSGEGAYGQKVIRAINESPYRDAILVLGRVDTEKRLEVLRKSHLLISTSVKEGWGLVVTEAASQGTPAVVYDVDGLRDSVRDGKTGMITKKNTPASLGEGIVALLNDPAQYETLRKNAWEWSKDITFEKCYEDFKKALGEK